MKTRHHIEWIKILFTNWKSETVASQQSTAPNTTVSCILNSFRYEQTRRPMFICTNVQYTAWYIATHTQRARISELPGPKIAENPWICVVLFFSFWFSILSTTRHDVEKNNNHTYTHHAHIMSSFINILLFAFIIIIVDATFAPDVLVLRIHVRTRTHVSQQIGWWIYKYGRWWYSMPFCCLLWVFGYLHMYSVHCTMYTLCTSHTPNNKPHTHTHTSRAYLDLPTYMSAYVVPANIRKKKSFIVIA